MALANRCGDDFEVTYCFHRRAERLGPTALDREGILIPTQSLAMQSRSRLTRGPQQPLPEGVVEMKLDELMGIEIDELLGGWSMQLTHVPPEAAPEDERSRGVFRSTCSGPSHGRRADAVPSFPCRSPVDSGASWGRHVGPNLHPGRRPRPRRGGRVERMRRPLGTSAIAGRPARGAFGRWSPTARWLLDRAWCVAAARNGAIGPLSAAPGSTFTSRRSRCSNSL